MCIRDRLWRTNPVSLAATKGIAIAFFSCGYLDVSVHHVRPASLCIQPTVIQESWDQRLFDNFPRLFAAFHALHRLLTPRHPPYALIHLVTKIHNSAASCDTVGILQASSLIEQLYFAFHHKDGRLEEWLFRCHSDICLIVKEHWQVANQPHRLEGM